MFESVFRHIMLKYSNSHLNIHISVFSVYPLIIAGILLTVIIVGVIHLNVVSLPLKVDP